MVDDRFAANPPVDKLPHLAWFGVFCVIDSGGGFWNPEEEPRLDAIENRLLQLCEQHANGWAAYVQRLDTAGLREYYLYFGEGATMEKVLPELKAAYPTYRLEFDRIDDLKWAQYRKWLSWVVKGNNQPLQWTGCGYSFPSSKVVWARPRPLNDVASPSSEYGIRTTYSCPACRRCPDRARDSARPVKMRRRCPLESKNG